MSDSEENEEFERYGNAPIAPLSQESHQATLAKGRFVAGPAYAQSMQSGVSSNIGHPTYYDQMQAKVSREKSFDRRSPNKCNRIYSYFNLLDFVVQCLLMLYLLNEHVFGSTFSMTACRADNACLMVMGYALLTVLVMVHLLYRLCFVCLALNKGQEHNDLLWMHRIADHCCIPMVFGLVACCRNMAALSYYVAIDESKAFPTTSSFLLCTLFKILNIAFCALYAYLNGMDVKVMAVGGIYVLTFMVSINRMRLRSKARWEQRVDKLSVNSV